MPSQIYFSFTHFNKSTHNSSANGARDQDLIFSCSKNTGTRLVKFDALKEKNCSLYIFFN